MEYTRAQFINYNFLYPEGNTVRTLTEKNGSARRRYERVERRENTEQWRDEILLLHSEGSRDIRPSLPKMSELVLGVHPRDNQNTICNL